VATCTFLSSSMMNSRNLPITINSTVSKQTDTTTDTNLRALPLNYQLEQIALFLAEAWKDEHFDPDSDPKADFTECVAYVTAEMAIAATLVGGSVGLEILTGGGSIAARRVCQRLFL
jgi:hypothetical protein